MADFVLEQRLAHPPGTVMAAYRDRLEELVTYLENIESITLLERSEEGGTIRQVARWQATAEGHIPRVARPFVSKKYLQWIDHAEWDEKELVCRWRFEFPALPRAAAHCSGTNYYVEAPDGGCTLRLTGDLQVDLAGIRGVPRMARGLGPRVERIALGRVKPNLETVTDAVRRLLGQ